MAENSRSQAPKSSASRVNFDLSECPSIRRAALYVPGNPVRLPIPIVDQLSSVHAGRLNSCTRREERSCENYERGRWQPTSNKGKIAISLHAGLVRFPGTVDPSTRTLFGILFQLS